MRKSLALKLKALCQATSFGDVKAARRRYRQLKRDWNATPWNQRHALYISLAQGTVAMMEAKARADVAEANAALAEAQQAMTAEGGKAIDSQQSS